MKLKRDLFVVFMLLLVSCGTKAPSPGEQAAVEAVWDQYLDATIVASETFGTGGVNGRDLDPFLIMHVAKLQRMRTIDVSRCPGSFQGAWEDYLSALSSHQPSNPIGSTDSEDPLRDLEDWMENARPLGEAEQALFKEFVRYSPKIALEVARENEFREGKK